ncbi:MAG: hypothetical protein IT581_02315 [Verrucomicrobiales bacterium]|nr:hypothetical protein [Verrucomicrobiales bacterium]
MTLHVLALSTNASTYHQWTARHNLTGVASGVRADPDGDGRINALEYAFGSDPSVAEPAAFSPVLRLTNGLAVFTYPVGNDAKGEATYRVFEAENVEDLSRGVEIDGTPHLEAVTAEYSVYSQYFDASVDLRFYRLAVKVPLLAAPGADPVTLLVGSDIGGGYWDGLPTLPQVYVRTEPPNVSDTVQIPNRTKYPEVAGASQVAVTSDMIDTLAQNGRRLPHRSWMGWFLWANGTPPPGINPGYPSSGTYDTNRPWDFFSYQYPAKGANQDPPGQSWSSKYGAWTPIRIDQQPLYANPFRVNYAWPPGAFGYKSQPLLDFRGNVGFWADKRIVRGPNLSFANPFFQQYGDYVGVGDTPDVWRESWFYQRTRPLETLLLVPSNLKPDDLLQNGAWNATETAGQNDPFPYPVWNPDLPAREQTPFAILTDRLGDWDADIIWEGTNPRAAGYETNRYHRTPFDKPGIGNYLKMTVAQGSPFIWCEANNNRYQIFYDLIRQNLTNRIANNLGTDAKVVPGGPWTVPGVSGVSYVLLYGDHTNPNQFHHAETPGYFNQTTGESGGFNPPGAQHNHTYVAVFYRTDSVLPVALGNGGGNSTANNGTDLQGNPYFYLEFKNPGKNWFVVGAVPVMSYYHSGVAEDSEVTRVAAARSWAEQLGSYAFNFVVDTRISYAADNMASVSTTYRALVQNPYVSAGDPTASSLTASTTATVMSLLPHQYQPLTLGPDLTKVGRPQVVWRPLQGYDRDFPTPASVPANANRNDPNSPSHWDYWCPRGTMKTIITGSFVTRYPFQNFLPVMPPANFETNYPMTGVQAVRVTNTGTGNHAIDNSNLSATIHTAPGVNGSGATFKVLLESYTGRIMQVDVVNGGQGYPDGNPPNANDVWITLDPPQTPPANGGVQATARLQTSGGKVVAVFMNNKGAGYESSIAVRQNGVAYDAPIIQPPFDNSGNLTTGLASIISSGAGFDFNGATPPSVQVLGTGTGATAEIIPAGGIVSIQSSGIGGFASDGLYPSSGNDAEDLARVQVHIKSPNANTDPQGIAVTGINRVAGLHSAIYDKGKYASAPTAAILDENGAAFALTVIFDSINGWVNDVVLPNQAVPPFLIAPKDVTFTGGNPTRPAKVKIYGSFAIKSLGTVGPLVPGYGDNTEITFSGGEIPYDGVTMPVIQYGFKADGTLDPASLKLISPGTGWFLDGYFTIAGGRGYDAAAVPVINNGQLTQIRILRGGTHYPTNIYLVAHPDPAVPGQFKVRVEGGVVVGVDVISPGSGYAANTVLAFTSALGSNENTDPAKGRFAEIHFGLDGNGGLNPGLIGGPLGSGYIPGTEQAPTADSPAAFLQNMAASPVAKVPGQAAGYVARVVPKDISIKQVMYDNLIQEYSILTGNDLKPFGAGIGGGGPDGYGLGGTLSAAAKVVGLLYNFQQYYADRGADQADIIPSSFAANAVNKLASAYEFPIYQANQPAYTLSGALKTSVQALQRTLSLFHQNPPYTNSPATNDWHLQYFAQYDPGVGRVVINPSGSLPTFGAVSSVLHPPDLPAEENSADPKKSWERGKLFTGFFVSDQWNDQHYFNGYYLSTAGLAAILDGSWEPSLAGRPPVLWSDPSQMGTAIDQWLMTLAYDPDNADLNAALNFETGFNYQKFAFFDQWNGHGWATGLSPGRDGDVEDGQFGVTTPMSIMRHLGTMDSGYDDENENSVWEGNQAWSAIVLWGAGTDRKPVVDLGMYLLATGNAAGDAYFHDKNYNLPRTADNQYSWVPVTTIDSSAVGPNGGNLKTPANTGFVETMHEAFYTAPVAFGGAASSGTSILQKGSPSLNNFFYAPPTGTKFIQSFPLTSWTLGMTRNSDYMRRWAGAMMRQEWTDARDSSLFQPADWLGMALACAASGVPYNPGDQPYSLTETTLRTNAPQPYVKRLWSDWVTLNAPAGAQGAYPPMYRPVDILNTLHTFDAYGTPDWTYVAKATTTAGDVDQTSIVFTAAFSKLIDATTVRTTFVVFNPGWVTRSADFFRLAPDGTIGATPVLSDMPISVPPKRTRIVTHDFLIQ